MIVQKAASGSIPPPPTTPRPVGSADAAFLTSFLALDGAAKTARTGHLAGAVTDITDDAGAEDDPQDHGVTDPSAVAMPPHPVPAPLIVPRPVPDNAGGEPRSGTMAASRARAIRAPTEPAPQDAAGAPGAPDTDPGDAAVLVKPTTGPTATGGPEGPAQATICLDPASDPIPATDPGSPTAPPRSITEQAWSMQGLQPAVQSVPLSGGEKSPLAATTPENSDPTADPVAPPQGPDAADRDLVPVTDADAAVAFRDDPAVSGPAGQEAGLNGAHQFAAGSRTTAPAAPVNSTSAPMPHPAQSVAAALLPATVAVRDGAVTLALSPDELGPLQMRMTQTDGTLHVTLSADRPETLDLLRRHAGELAQDLRQAGFAATTFSFTRGDGTETPPSPRHPPRPGHPDPAGPFAAVVQDPAYPTRQPPSAATGATLDLRL